MATDWYQSIFIIGILLRRQSMARVFDIRIDLRMSFVILRRGDFIRPAVGFGFYIAMEHPGAFSTRKQGCQRMVSKEPEKIIYNAAKYILLCAKTSRMRQQMEMIRSPDQVRPGFCAVTQSHFPFGCS